MSTWACDVVLADGGPVHLRPIDVADAGAYRAFHDRQSNESVYYRYFSARPELGDAELDRVVTVDMADRAALVAVDGEVIIGIASYDRWPGRADAEVAFFVDDAHHGRGLATVLLEHLAAVARANGIERFTAEVLADNRAMLSVFSKAGWPIERAFDSGIVDIVFPLESTPGLVDSIERRERLADARSLARLLFPRSVAVVGASDDPHSPGWAIVRNLLRCGFQGPVHPVNPNRAHVASIACASRVTDIAAHVDLAVIAVPSDALVSVVEDCAAKHVRGLIVCTEVPDDFDNAGLVSYVRRHGMRLIGPASMGVLVTGERPLGAHLAWSADQAQTGGVAISLQSGPLGASVLELARRLQMGISTFVSLGERADVSGNDLLQYAEDDAATRVVAMYTETFGNPRKFARIARRLAMHTPIVAVRAGPVGDPTSVDVLYEQAGVIPVASVPELLDTARVLADQPLPAGDRVVVVTNARNPARLAAAALARQGFVIAELIDLTWRAGPADYGDAVRRMVDDAVGDALLVIHAPPVPHELEAPARAVAEAAAEAPVPVLAVMLGAEEGPLVPGSPVPSFSFPEPAAAVLGRARRLARWREVRTAELAEVPFALSESAQVRVRHVIDTALAARPTGTLLPLAASVELLSAHGVRFSPARMVTSLDDAVDAFGELGGGPVCLKAVGRGRRGVRLDLGSVDELVAAWRSMEGVVEAMVQRMVAPGVDVRVAVEVDAALGPVVSVGLGGVHSRAIGDRVARLAPFGSTVAHEAVHSSRAAVAVASMGGDIGPLVDLVHRVAVLADTASEVDHLELNPVVVGVDGAIAVDASIRVVPVGAGPHAPPLRRL
jgi:acyl-CoA synthetase (NDP forming)/GNAT superfamily N-acetyltransferase